MFKVQKIRFEGSDIPHWTVIDNNFLPVSPINQYLIFLRNTKKSIYTIKTYAHHLRLFWEFLAHYKLNWETINLDYLAKFIVYLNGNIDDNVIHLVSPNPKRSERTINLIIQAVSSFYQFQYNLGNITNLNLHSYKKVFYSQNSYKPLLHHITKHSKKKHLLIKLKETKELPKTIDRGTITKLINACHSKRDKFLVCLLYETGCRIGQALGLRHEDIESFNNTIIIRPRSDNLNYSRAKSTEINTVHVTKELMSLYFEYYMEEYGDIDSDYVFVNIWNGKIGMPIHYDTVKGLFNKLSKRIGYKVTPHMLRHSHATELLNSGWSMEHVQKRLGHKNIETTINNYIHLTNNNMKDEYKKFINKREKNEES